MELPSYCFYVLKECNSLMADRGFVAKEVDGVRIYTIPAFTATRLVKHGFSTRLGGVSTGECATLNLGYKRKDKLEAVTENFRRFCRATDIPADNMVFTDQVHGDVVRAVGREDKGKGFVRTSDIYGTDGFVTNEPGIALVTFYADCVPLFFLDPVNKAIGLSHSGWRGTVAQIGKKTVTLMGERFGTRPVDCLVGIGPSIGSCCFEVDRPVADAFWRTFPAHRERLIRQRGKKYDIDLWEANRAQLLEAGIPEKNITIASLCTCCSRDIFFSHRGDVGRTGSLAAILMLI
jgi:YfiH family protein